MNRFLIAFVKNNNSGLEISQEIFKVSNDCSPYDVTVPMNTLLFMFISANAKTAKELTESFVTFKVGTDLFMHSSFELTPEENGKRYWIGRLVRIDNTDRIYNEHIRALIPISSLAENDEVIDL